MEQQRYFHMCQKCHKIVEKIYQKGYCKSCLVEHFKEFQPLLNDAHAVGKEHRRSDLPLRE